VRRRDIVAGTIAVLLAAGCVRLGIWQIHRLQQRRARNALLAARLALPPLALRGNVPLPVDSVRERRVVTRGTFDYSREQTWPGRSFEGTPGVGLITPLRLADGGELVLVDRGWVPSPDAFHVDHAAYREADTVRVEGIAFAPPRGRGDVNPAGYLPYVIQMEAPLPGGRGLPRRWPAPVLDDGPHLSYAIQWFSFAVIALVGTAALLRRRP
jgi:surfeit locus 1 family protein